MVITTTVQNKIWTLEVLRVNSFKIPKTAI